MSRAARAIGALVIIGLFVVIGSIAPTPQLRLYWCDGYMPLWMLEAQRYDGGGCAIELPFWEAPPNADWTQVCLGLCPDSLLDPTVRPPSPWTDQ